MNWQDHIEQNPEVMLGKPVFKGTRLTVQLVLERMANGFTESDLLAAYPTLKPVHIRAALAYAAAALATDEMVFLAEGAT